MNSIPGYIEKHPQEAQRLVGINFDQLKQLMKQAIAMHAEVESEAELKKTRIIKKGGGRKRKLSLEEQILLTLIYLRQFTTFQLLGIQFGVSETTANDTFNYWFPLLGKMLPPSLIEQVKKTNLNTRLLKNF
ncbi:MAG: transposase family protein [Cyanobacteria bacterium J06629_18]